MKEKVVIVENLSFSYGKNKVLDDINLYIEEGDFVGIIGPNGSAKSTLIRLILGLLKPDRGTIKLFNRPIDEFKDFHKIGYIPQYARDFNPMFPATVEEVIGANIQSMKKSFKRMGKEEKDKIDQVLKIVEIEDLKKQKIGNLSGGQKQRVFIARALVNNPRILFMDEPLVGVDLESQNRFYKLMDRLNKEHNITLVMISHDIGVIYDKVNRIICMSKGKAYGHDLNKCQPIDIVREIYGENMNLLFHDH
ncbi:MAG: ABC transporter ATP-binding protein [Tissierellia bacterium]|nr:ABC transporter ATP-binding protein [Tissierellia bacterium]